MQKNGAGLCQSCDILLVTSQLVEGAAEYCCDYNTVVRDRERKRRCMVNGFKSQTAEDTISGRTR